VTAPLRSRSTWTQWVLRAVQLRWLGQRRILAYSRILALVFLISMVWPYLVMTGVSGSDFQAFWSAARLIVSGAASSVYDVGAVHAIQNPMGKEYFFPFVNPPPMLLVVWPLGFLPFNLAWVAWIAATFAFWFAMTRLLAKDLSWPIIAFPGALLGAWHAQTGLLTGGLQAAAAGLLRYRPFLAGLCVGGLIIKPHLALLFPIALAAGKHWRAFAGAAFSVIALLALTWLTFGTDAILNYQQGWAMSGLLMEIGDKAFFLRQVTVYAALRVALSVEAAVAAQALVTLGVAILTWKAWSRAGPLEGKLALLMAATPLATPYLFSYDLPFLILPLCWLIGEARSKPMHGWERPVLLFFYLSPLVTRTLAMPLGANLMPWVHIWILWAVWKRLAARGDSN
jgi:hypothetical protein